MCNDSNEKYIDVSDFHKGEILDIHGLQNIIVSGDYLICGDTVCVKYEGKLSFDGTDLELNACVCAGFITPCARCLKETNAEFEFSISEKFSKSELSEDKIDFAEVLQDVVLTEMPKKVLCDESCGGLCQYCGHNLNEGVCGCQKPIDARLEGLKDFFKEVREDDLSKG